MGIKSTRRYKTHSYTFTQFGFHFPHRKDGIRTDMTLALTLLLPWIPKGRPTQVMIKQAGLTLWIVNWQAAFSTFPDWSSIPITFMWGSQSSAYTSRTNGVAWKKEAIATTFHVIETLGRCKKAMACLVMDDENVYGVSHGGGSGNIFEIFFKFMTDILNH